MSTKDYGGWSVEKLRLNNLATVPFFRERQIWWAALGLNIGFEEDGKSAKYSRPVLIVRKFNHQFFLGVPLSTTHKTGPYYASVTVAGESRSALLSQLRAYDARRLLDIMTTTSPTEFDSICQQLRGLIPAIEPEKVCPRFEGGGSE